MTTPRNLRNDAFAGTAAAYARYRPAYPRALLDDLMARAAVGPDGALGPSGVLGPSGALLDLACGPGRVALDLAGSFETVWAIDLEPEMVEVGRQAARRRGLGNVTWFEGRAEDLTAAAGAFDLITIGEAFHRLDQALIADRALGWLKAGGCLATLGSEGPLAGPEPWQMAVSEVAHRWMDKAFPQGWGVARDGADVGPGSQERVLRRAGFVEVASVTLEEQRDWSFEAIAGYLQSMSVCSRRALGGDFAVFEAELRGALGGPTEAQTFRGSMNWGFTLGRKPWE